MGDAAAEYLKVYRELDEAAAALSTAESNYIKAKQKLERASKDALAEWDLYANSHRASPKDKTP